jgi:GNAT superfamily N-acetyltransferase
MTLQIDRIETRDLAAREAIFTALEEFTDAASGMPEPVQWLGLLLREPGSDRVVGGLWGMSYYRWLFVELLFVPASMRGQGLGTELMRQAESVARARGCHGIWLDTFSFQAPDFYERLGFDRFGTIDAYPLQHSRLFFQKRLEPLG